MDLKRDINSLSRKVTKAKTREEARRFQTFNSRVMQLTQKNNKEAYVEIKGILKPGKKKGRENPSSILGPGAVRGESGTNFTRPKRRGRKGD